jgi:putative phosphoribosyl transferase
MAPEREIHFGAGDRRLSATLATPGDARALVIFAHGSGSGRRSPRNRFVASKLNESGIATLLLDLLTENEERLDDRTASLRFDIKLLARRITAVTEWAREQKQLARLPVGYFGASTGAGAALLSASERTDVYAIVSRGGRPDLAGDALRAVSAPTLLIVGARDPVVLDLNRNAASQLRHSEIAIVPEATHLFEEPGALETVVSLAQRWFLQHLPERRPA